MKRILFQLTSVPAFGIGLMLLIASPVRALAEDNKTAEEGTRVVDPARKDMTKAAKDTGAAAKKSADKTKKTKVRTTKSGLQIEDRVVGTGPAVQKGDTVEVDYTGKLQNGNVFDSSVGREHFKFKVGEGQVIQGWEEGLLGMQAGGKRTLTIPPKLGYGDRDMGVIPPKSTLIFDIDLHKIEPGRKK